MESGSIADNQLTSSAVPLSGLYAYYARLNGPHYWFANYDRPTWIQADLLSAFIVTGLQTQGSNDENWYIKALSVETGLDVSALQPIMETGTNITKVIVNSQPNVGLPVTA